MNRKRVLWPLLLVATFSLGVIVAQVQADSIFLPLVASASTGEETPTPSGTVRVENVHISSSMFMSYLRGELVNESGHAIHAAGVLAYLMDADGLPVANAIGRSMAPILLPGERTPFEVRQSGHWPAWDSYVVYPQWAPIDRLAIESVVLTETEFGNWHVAATVHNQLPVWVETAEVGMVLYGPAGEVVGYAHGHTSLGPFAPGETLVARHTFDHWDWHASVEPVGCAAFAVPSTSSVYLLLEQQTLGQ